jgi:hypothetical protein
MAYSSAILEFNFAASSSTPGAVGWSASAGAEAFVYFVNGGRRPCREPFSYQSDRTSKRLRSAPSQQQQSSRSIRQTCNRSPTSCLRFVRSCFVVRPLRKHRAWLRNVSAVTKMIFIVTQLQEIAAMRLGLGSRCLRPPHRPIRLRSRQRTIGNLAGSTPVKE